VDVTLIPQNRGALPALAICPRFHARHDSSGASWGTRPIASFATGTGTAAQTMGPAMEFSGGSCHHARNPQCRVQSFSGGRNRPRLGVGSDGGFESDFRADAAGRAANHLLRSRVWRGLAPAPIPMRRIGPRISAAPARTLLRRCAARSKLPISSRSARSAQAHHRVNGEDSGSWTSTWRTSALLFEQHSKARRAGKIEAQRMLMPW